MGKEIRKARHDEVAPLINENSRVLLLGSMLSPKSAEHKFYYAHPQNRFWRTIFAVFKCEYSSVFKDQAEFALSHGIALWDVIASCDIEGASDSSIKNVVYNDINGLLKQYPGVKQIFTTGGKAYELLMRYNRSVKNAIIANAVKLPSTSPLNCKTKLHDLITAYSVITASLDQL